MTATAPPVEIVEVGPRDGLQNEPEHFSAEQKIEYVTQMVAAGLRRIEVTSFVNPKLVPQMADAEEVLQGVPARDDVTYTALLFNQRGVERAIVAGVKEINFGLACTQTFNGRNQARTIPQSIEIFGEVAELARQAGIRPTLVLGVAFGCPFEGEVPVERVVEVAKRCLDHGPTELALGDTIGCASPADMTAKVAAVKSLVGPEIPIRIHLHNTRSAGLANAYAAVQAGATALDASTGGIGGCPFAPKATGNVATEDLLYMLRRMGQAPDVDLDALIETVRWLQGELGRETDGAMSKAGVFPFNDGLEPME
jgi:hydroxymethylglutaryl-CoA lyase